MDRDEPTHTSPLHRLRARIMAAAYNKYQTMGTRSKEDLVEDADNSYGRRSQNERKYLMPALLICTLVLLVLTALLVWQHVYYTSNQKCLSADCVAASAFIAAKLDGAADPCDDFYQYACGGWEKNTYMPPDKAKYGAFSEIADQNERLLNKVLSPTTLLSDFGNRSLAVHKARTYYENCMDTETINAQGITPILQLIKMLDSWSVTSDNISGPWVESSWDLQHALCQSHQIGHSAFFSVSVGQDDKASNVNIIQFFQSGLTLGDREEYFNNSSEKYRKGFLGFAIKVGELLQGGNQTKEKMKALYSFEKSLAEIMIPKENLTDPEETYHKMTVAEFQKLVGPQLNVSSYLSHLFGYSIADSASLLCNVPGYFSRLGILLANTTKEVLANYIVWNTLQAIPGHMPEEFLGAALLLTKAELGINTLRPRWQRCVSKTLDSVGFAVSSLFVKEKFSLQNKIKVEEMLKNVKDAFIRNLEAVSWMDSTTRSRAAEKANNMNEMIGYPEWITDVAKLDEYYDKLNITSGHFLLNHMEVNVFDSQRVLGNLGKPADRFEWQMWPAEVNAYYAAINNQIVVPAAILQKPFFSDSVPMSFNYGSIGMVAGHELTHGFDNYGRMYDSQGNLKNWWTNESAAGFENSTECVVKQYSEYTVQGSKLNGRYLLAENIADNGGLKASYQAFSSLTKRGGVTFVPLPGLDLSQDKLFFVGFAQSWCTFYTPEYARQSVVTDEHSYAKYRVIGPLSNSEEFSKTFSCPLNSRMNPEKKCKVW